MSQTFKYPLALFDDERRQAAADGGLAVAFSQAGLPSSRVKIAAQFCVIKFERPLNKMERLLLDGGSVEPSPMSMLGEWLAGVLPDEADEPNFDADLEDDAEDDEAEADQEADDDDADADDDADDADEDDEDDDADADDEDDEDDDPGAHVRWNLTVNYTEEPNRSSNRLVIHADGVRKIEVAMHLLRIAMDLLGDAGAVLPTMRQIQQAQAALAAQQHPAVCFSPSQKVWLCQDCRAEYAERAELSDLVELPPGGPAAPCGYHADPRQRPQPVNGVEAAVSSGG